jgi:hypothetical protein
MRPPSAPPLACAASISRSTSTRDMTLGNGRPSRGESSVLAGSSSRNRSARRKRKNWRITDSRRATVLGVMPR